ncbi:MAG: nuclear transport factor 2 family protein [Alphaproteobacteria bacterium]|nr:nuclear transport factor 2 family protein [Alphaproteobacteria bacterium]
MTEDATAKATRAVAERMLGAISAGDVETLIACVDEDVHFYMPGQTDFHGHFEGRDAWLEAATSVLEQLAEPLALSVENMIIAGHWAVVQASGSSKTLSGQPYNQTFCFIWYVENGKIVDITEYHDTDVVRRVLLNDA